LNFNSARFLSREKKKTYRHADDGVFALLKKHFRFFIFFPIIVKDLKKKRRERSKIQKRITPKPNESK
jgi:hypothetical protein